MNKKSVRREAVNQYFREATNRVFAWICKVFAVEKFEDYTEVPKYQKELELYRSVQLDAKPDANYLPIVDYAKQLLERCDKTEKSLDEKADSIIKYLGGGTTLVALGAFLSLKPDNARVCLMASIALFLFIPSFLFAVQALRYAIASLTPKQATTLGNLEHVIAITEGYETENKVKVQLWLMLFPICEAYLHRNEIKSFYVTKAHNYYMRAIFCLLLPLTGIAILLLFAHFRIQ